MYSRNFSIVCMYACFVIRVTVGDGSLHGQPNEGTHESQNIVPFEFSSRHSPSVQGKTFISEENSKQYNVSAEQEPYVHRRKLLLSSATIKPGKMPSVAPLNEANYMPPFCRQPATRKKSPSYQFLTFSSSAPSSGGLVPSKSKGRLLLPQVPHSVGGGSSSNRPASPSFGSRTPESRIVHQAAKPASRVTKPVTRSFSVSVNSGISGRRRRRLLSVSKKTRLAGWAEGHPSPSDLGFIQRVVQNRGSYCPFAVKECVVAGVNREVADWEKGPGLQCCVKGKDTSCCTERVLVLKEMPPFPQDMWNQLPSVPQKSWGTCAFVASGDNLLGKKRGEEIDNHDLVIRLGLQPLKGFEAYVGSRTDVVFTRAVSSRMNSKFMHSTKFYIGSVPKEMKGKPGFRVGLEYWGTDRSPIKAGDTDSKRVSPRVTSKIIYERMTKKFKGENDGKLRTRQPTTGFTWALQLIFSGFCERLDLYGFSMNGGPVYYSPKGAYLKVSHSAELESWVFHHLMKTYWKELGMCVYI